MVAQVVFELISGRPVPTCFSGEAAPTAERENEGQHESGADEQSINHDSKRARWTRDENDRLIALKKDGFDWSELADRLPGRTIGSLRQRWYAHQVEQGMPSSRKRKKRKCKLANRSL